MVTKCNLPKARSGLSACVTWELQPTLITPLEAALAGDAGFAFAGVISPGVTFPDIPADGVLTVENYDDLSAHLTARAIPIQNTNDQSEVAWFLDNLGSGTECCDSGTGLVEYTTLLTGLSVEIPRSTHGITGFPNVTVIKPGGAVVSVCVDYVGNSVFITSNVPLDNHTAILR